MADLIFYLLIWLSGLVIGFAMATTEYWRALVRETAIEREKLRDEEWKI